MFPKAKISRRSFLLYDKVKNMDVKLMEEQLKKAKSLEEAGDLKEAHDLCVAVGKALRDEGEEKNAAIALKRAVQCDPKSSVSHFLLGNLLWAGGDQAAAAQHYEEAAKSALQDKRLGEAKKSLLRLKELRADHLDTFLLLAEVAYLEGDESGAWSHLIEALHRTLQQGEISDVPSILYRLIAVGKKDPRPLLDQARQLSGEENYPLALQLLLEAFRLAPDQKEGINQLGDFLRIIHKPHLAETILAWKREEGRGATKLSQKLLDAEILVQERLFLEAQKIYREILREYPNQMEAREKFRLIQDTLKQEKGGRPPIVRSVEEMIVDLEQLLDLEPAEETATERCRIIAENVLPNDYESHYALGIAFFQMCCFDEAARHMHLAKKSKKYEIDAIYLLGCCYVEMHQANAAIPLLEETLRAKTLTEEAELAVRYTLGQAYALARDYQKAAYHFRTVEQTDRHYRRVEEYIRDLSRLS